MASYVPATGATHHMWSMCPWVTQHGDRLEPVLADDLGDAGGGVLAGVDDDALGCPGPVATT